MAFGWGSDDASKRRVDLAALEQRYRDSGIATRYYNPAVHLAAFALPNYVAELLLRRASAARESPPADVAAAEAFRPVDLVDGGIGECLGLLDGGRHGGDVEHAAAAGQYLPARPLLRAGMEDLHVVRVAAGQIESTDHAAFLVGARIALGSHHEIGRAHV